MNVPAVDFSTVYFSLFVYLSVSPSLCLYDSVCVSLLEQSFSFSKPFL